MVSGAPTVWLTTLGCSKNQVDSDKLTAVLDGAGYGRASTPEGADVVMVNTCAFIEDARRESVGAILDLADAKRSEAGLVVLGCMAQRYEEELAEALPEADAIVGLDRYGELVRELDRVTEWQPLRITGAPASRMDILYETKRPTPDLPYAYVKVAEGCDKTCAFCAIPLIRGKQRSRSADNVVTEVSGLAAAGVGEIVLVSQDLAAYGRDTGAGDDLTSLLRSLRDVEGLRRIRLFYLHPREIRPALIEEMAGSPIVADYFDLSLQHVSEHLLRTMRRPGSGKRHLGLIDDIRRFAPEAALRSSFIVGFPGETEDDLDELASFLGTARLDWAGFFPFSAEDGTTAAELENRVPQDEVRERMRHLQRIQDDVTTTRNLEQRGRVLEVVVDQVEEGQPVGRSYREAPEIDGVVLLDRGTPGSWVEAEITGGFGTDLVGVVAG
ncbi:MAG: 30S ribosomal protein S12 methylthiotransferase RimO [Acidimicrobiia bacterium]